MERGRSSWLFYLVNLLTIRICLAWGSIIDRDAKMDKIEAFRSIRYDLLEHIQQKVWVDFDNTMQYPVGFHFQGKKRLIHEVLGRFRTHMKEHINAFLVNANDDEVYFLYFQQCNMDEKGTLFPGFWVLSFRILNDRE